MLCPAANCYEGYSGNNFTIPTSIPDSSATIHQGNCLWLNARFDPSIGGQSTYVFEQVSVTVYHPQYGQYSLDLPSATIQLNGSLQSSAQGSTTYLDGRWQTSVPASISGALIGAGLCA